MFKVGHKENKKEYAEVAEVMINDLEKNGTFELSGICRRCYKIRKNVPCSFRENVSFIFRRWEYNYSEHLCFLCMTRICAEFTLITLLGTWGGIKGMFLGPIYITENLIEYFKNCYKLAKK